MNLDKKPAKVAIIVPAFNEEDSISAIVSEISAYGVAIVVNDGSTDNTEQLASAAGAFVISLEVNRGYDNALATGVAQAVAEKFEFAITLDGDGQHEPVLIKSFLSELLDGADLVVGIRDRYQRFSEKMFAVLTQRLWGISDPLCGMKAYRLSKLKGIDSLCSYPSIGTELTMRAARSGWNIRQVPVRTRDRNDRSRFGVGFYANWLILRAMLLGLLRTKAYTTNSDKSS